MPWEYSEKHMWKMATSKEDALIQYHNKENQDDKVGKVNLYNWDQKLNETDANDDGDDDATQHFTTCVALHIEHTHKYIHWERASWACGLVPCARSPYSHWLKFFALCHCHPHAIGCSLFTLILSGCLLPSFPPVCLPLPLLPPQPTSSSLSSTRRSWKTCATPPTTGVRTPTTSSTSHRLWAQRPWLQRAPELIGPPLLQDPCRGPGRRWPDTQQDAHWSVPRTNRLLRTRRRVSQSVVVVCKVDRSGQPDGEMVDRSGSHRLLSINPLSSPPKKKILSHLSYGCGDFCILLLGQEKKESMQLSAVVKQGHVCPEGRREGQ